MSFSVSERQRWMAVLARASLDELRTCLDAASPLPPHRRLRGPETGLIMLRGQAAAVGDRFNLAEITVTRCAVSLEGGTVGHAYLSGRDAARAELAAILDALLQDDATKPAWMAAVIEPLAAIQAENEARQRRKAAATKVQFMTMATTR
ncbi:phosphonate C-P lyase system protein PhnG [Teichococcus oryzae]|uniref:Phosphonate C-P lyase system protein PhnG n=1 Tax=Teichococcus oryzae TaxID=1608942 RepID=A0A5B2TA39_9PROT|nr:phosphonate C-P lyase system protein PhnG [Pseudoroseomonas oryzae]KAA2211467.1 phosphonate C-P lyase system protein PhnG [Pseudoroseomonas oryzae]